MNLIELFLRRNGKEQELEARRILQRLPHPPWRLPLRLQGQPQPSFLPHSILPITRHQTPEFQAEYAIYQNISHVKYLVIIVKFLIDLGNELCEFYWSNIHKHSSVRKTWSVFSIIVKS
jgi:hypothetical protein